MAGPLDDILEKTPQYGAGLNTAILQFASPPFTFKTNAPSKAEMVELIDKSLAEGALGVKLLGGHYPLTPEVSSTLIKTALERRAYVAWHAGTSAHGSNLEGMIEAVQMADGYPLHLAHINAYCRGAIKNEIDEARTAVELLNANPNIFSESYISPKNGTRLTCGPDGKIQSKVTGNCLRHFGFTEDRDGVRKALLAHKAFAVYDAGGYSDLMTGEDAVKLWESHNTDVGGSFNINPPIPRILLAQVKRPDGAFVVDAISTDGGCIPRRDCRSLSSMCSRLPSLLRRRRSILPACCGLRIRGISRSAPTQTSPFMTTPRRRRRCLSSKDARSSLRAKCSARMPTLSAPNAGKRRLRPAVSRPLWWIRDCRWIASRRFERALSEPRGSGAAERVSL